MHFKQKVAQSIGSQHFFLTDAPDEFAVSGL